MQVQTFECEETVDETPEMSEEARSIIERLDLGGQRELYSTKDENPVSRMPYREMTAEEKFVFQNLCPVETPLVKYSASPIPVRVLQVAAHANDLFEKIVVWHPRSATEPDPVLLGTRGQYSETKRFMLARWGDVLEEMPALRKLALVRWRENTTAALKAAISEIQQGLAWVESASVDLAATVTTEPTFYFTHQ